MRAAGSRRRAPLGWRAAVLLLTVQAVAGCTATAAPAPVPSTSSAAPRGVVDMLVPSVVGRRADNASSVVSASGFAVAFSQTVGDPTRYLVTAQQPPAGATGAPGSSVRLTVVAIEAGSPLTGPLTTPVGLTFDIAEAACNAHGRATSAATGASPDAWNAVFSVGRSRLEGDILVLVGDVPVSGPDAVQLLRTVECTVGGRDVAPVVEAFWVH